MELRNKYQQAKQKAKQFMQNGNIQGYVQALFEMNQYKSQLRQELVG
ncbi:MAG: hypothetical protein ACPGR7_02165 [Flavobacteriaceae bacterium]|nr:hypothetical protein [Flavobacteriaceae bacterium]